jgi:hydroxyversicolorone monooxygenase
MDFRTEVVGAYWKEELGQWGVRIRHTLADGKAVDKEDHCHILLLGTGILNSWKWPRDIKDLDKFEGKVIHTARWPESEQDWTGERVAVIGSGASSIQVVPAMQPYVKHMDVFVRSPVWFAPLAGNYGHNHEYTDEQRASFKRDPTQLMAHAKELDYAVNCSFDVVYKNAASGKKLKQDLEKRTALLVKDESLRKGLTPKWGVGCRRISPGDPYMT